MMNPCGLHHPLPLGNLRVICCVHSLRICLMHICLRLLCRPDADKPRHVSRLAVEDLARHEADHVVDVSMEDEGHGIGWTHHEPVIGLDGGRLEGIYRLAMAGRET